MPVPVPLRFVPKSSNICSMISAPPTFGLVLCADHDETVVEYALQDIAAPVAVSEYAHVLPSPDELRMGIDEGRRAFLQPTT